MEWFNACMNPLTVTKHYAVPPPLDPFRIFNCEVDAGPSFNVHGCLPRLPDNPIVREGQVPERADFSLAFLDLTSLELTGIPNRQGGRMQIEKLSESETRFDFESTTCRFSGTCNRAVIGWIQVMAKFDENHPEPRGPRLFAHPNVCNSCLLLLREYGYTLHVSGHSTFCESPARLRWHATKPDGTYLSADTPIELLGLAALHRYHNPNVGKDYWWHIDGPWIMKELIDEWEKQPIRP